MKTAAPEKAGKPATILTSTIKGTSDSSATPSGTMVFFIFVGNVILLSEKDEAALPPALHDGARLLSIELNRPKGNICNFMP
jgi:hypothetical protein